MITVKEMVDDLLFFHVHFELRGGKTIRATGFQDHINNPACPIITYAKLQGETGWSNFQAVEVATKLGIKGASAIIAAADTNNQGIAEINYTRKELMRLLGRRDDG